MRHSLHIAVAALLAATVASPALANLQLAQSKNCMGCHAVDKAIVGPAYKDVANKYAKDKDAEARLTKKVLKGGGGVWGNNMMPANTQVSEAEAKTLVKWVLGLK
jgi:cytochrome c